MSKWQSDTFKIERQQIKTDSSTCSTDNEFAQDNLTTEMV